MCHAYMRIRQHREKGQQWREFGTSSPSLHTGSRSCIMKRNLGNRSASLKVVDPIPPPTSTISASSASSGNGKAIDTR